MKSLVIAMALVAYVCAHERPTNLKSRSELTEAEIAEKREKWNGMSEEERQQIRNQHRGPSAEVRQRIHEKFESPEERQQMIGKIHEKMANKGRENFAKKTDEEKQIFREKFQAIHDKLSAMPEKERRQEIQKHREQHGQPQFMNIPVEIRQKMHEKFASLSPAERQALLEKIHGQRLSNQAEVLPVAVNHRMAQLTRDELKRPIRQGDFQRIRNVDEDRMIGNWNRPIRIKQE